MDYYWITAVVVSLSILTPGQLGEALKIELMKRRGLLDRLPGAGAFALERTLDLVVISGIAASSLIFGNFAASSPALKRGAVTLVILGIASLYFLLRFDPGGRIAPWLIKFRLGGSPRVWISMAVLTALSWGLVAAIWDIALRAVEIHLAFSQVLSLMSLVTIGTILSFIPGGWGVSEVVTTAILTRMGVVAVAAQAGALILRIQALIIILFGLTHLMLWPIWRIRMKAWCYDSPD